MSIQPESINDNDLHWILPMVEGIQQGNEEAFNRFYNLYADRLYRYLIVIAPRDENLVREALQETMFRVIRSIKPFPHESVLWGWLTRVARSKLFDQLRRRKKASKLDGTHLKDQVIPLYPNDDSSEDRLIVALRNVLSTLPEEERAIIEAYYFQGIQQSAVAKQVGTTAKAIESRMARLRRKLKSLILEALSNER
jgi:RNA polymerase sigma-70 factor (ECF subfamily)